MASFVAALKSQFASLADEAAVNRQPVVPMIASLPLTSEHQTMIEEIAGMYMQLPETAAEWPAESRQAGQRKWGREPKEQPAELFKGIEGSIGSSCRKQSRCRAWLHPASLSRFSSARYFKTQSYKLVTGSALRPMTTAILAQE
eukprot:s1434_g1.t1